VELARREDRSVSSVIRRAIENELERVDEEQDESREAGEIYGRKADPKDPLPVPMPEVY
jgi:predicted transcriptional regulator